MAILKVKHQINTVLLQNVHVLEYEERIRGADAKEDPAEDVDVKYIVPAAKI